MIHRVSSICSCLDRIDQGRSEVEVITVGLKTVKEVQLLNCTASLLSKFCGVSLIVYKPSILDQSTLSYQSSSVGIR